MRAAESGDPSQQPAMPSSVRSMSIINDGNMCQHTLLVMPKTDNNLKCHLFYNLDRGVGPLGFSVRRFGQGTCTGRPPLSTSIRIALSPHIGIISNPLATYPLDPFLAG